MKSGGAMMLTMAGAWGVTGTTYATQPADGERPILESHRVLRTFSGATEPDLFGFSARALDDIDGDGVIDFIVAASRQPNGALSRAGAIHAYSTATGERLYTCLGHAERGALGVGLGPAGDVDGDGMMDFIAGAADRGDNPGHAFVYSGRNGKPLHMLSAGHAGDRFGHKVHGAGDLDHDGHGDFIVGASSDDHAGDNAGRVYLMSGRTGEVMFTIDGEQPGARLGTSVAGDIWSDSGLIAMGAMDAGPDERGRVYVYRVTEKGPQRVFTIEPVESSRQLGAYALNFVGDVDADGTVDLAAPDYADAANGGCGRVLVHSGRTGERLLDLEGTSPGGDFGTSYGRVGDVNGDGHDDIVVGAWHHNDVAVGAGRCYLYSGRDGSLLTTYTGAIERRAFGHDAVGIGDVDGDGVIDLLISAAGNTHADHLKQGHVYIFSGPTPD